jgi:hypothetical protein
VIGDIECRSRYESNGAVLTTTVRSGQKYGFYKSRQCHFHVPGKLLAQTVAIYPCVGTNLPIFGSEYLEIGQKSFAAVDFHPSAGPLTDFGHLVEVFPPRPTLTSRHYDLDLWFGPLLWLERGEEELIERFESEYEARLREYYRLLNRNLHLRTGIPPGHEGFNQYMAANDPARGIIAAYFGRSFSDEYLRRVLFSQKNSSVVS